MPKSEMLTQVLLPAIKNVREEADNEYQAKLDVLMNRFKKIETYHNGTTDKFLESVNLKFQMNGRGQVRVRPNAPTSSSAATDSTGGEGRPNQENEVMYENFNGDTTSELESMSGDSKQKMSPMSPAQCVFLSDTNTQTSDRISIESDSSRLTQSSTTSSKQLLASDIFSINSQLNGSPRGSDDGEMDLFQREPVKRTKSKQKPRLVRVASNSMDQNWEVHLIVTKQTGTDLMKMLSNLGNKTDARTFTAFVQEIVGIIKIFIRNINALILQQTNFVDDEWKMKLDAKKKAFIKTSVRFSRLVKANYTEPSKDKMVVIMEESYMMNKISNSIVKMVNKVDVIQQSSSDEE